LATRYEYQETEMNRRAEMKAVHGAAAGIPEDEMAVGHLIGRARSSLLTGLDSELEPFGITGAQFSVLKYVADGVADTAADLCRTMHYDTGSMTRMLDRLEEKAVLRRERCTDDRRVVYLRITTTGNDLLPQLRNAAVRVLSRHLAGFSLEEVENLKRCLGRMIENGQSMSS
jgi:MarR family transcriptional regulator, multiple antibiotic resistance protein MarR